MGVICDDNLVSPLMNMFLQKTIMRNFCNHADLLTVNDLVLGLEHGQKKNSSSNHTYSIAGFFKLQKGI